MPLWDAVCALGTWQTSSTTPRLTLQLRDTMEDGPEAGARSVPSALFDRGRAVEDHRRRESEGVVDRHDWEAHARRNHSAPFRSPRELGLVVLGLAPMTLSLPARYSANGWKDSDPSPPYWTSHPALFRRASLPSWPLRILLPPSRLRACLLLCRALEAAVLLQLALLHTHKACTWRVQQLPAWAACACRQSGFSVLPSCGGHGPGT